MGFASSLQPASLADSMVNNWAWTNLVDLQAGAYPGLLDVNNMFKAMMMAPFTRQAGGGVEDIGYRNQLQMAQYPGTRGQISTNALDEENLFAKLLGQGAALGTGINAIIQRGRNQTSGGLLGTLGLGF